MKTVDFFPYLGVLIWPEYEGRKYMTIGPFLSEIQRDEVRQRIENAAAHRFSFGVPISVWSFYSSDPKQGNNEQALIKLMRKMLRGAVVRRNFVEWWARGRAA